jgi:hypothetical protein
MIKLENLVANPENELKRVMSFLDETFEPEMLSFYLKERQYYSQNIYRPENEKGEKKHRVYRNWQINQPLIKNTTRWINELNPEEIKYCEEQLSYYLKKFQYLKNNANNHE